MGNPRDTKGCLCPVISPSAVLKSSRIYYCFLRNTKLGELLVGGEERTGEDRSGEERKTKKRKKKKKKECKKAQATTGKILGL